MLGYVSHTVGLKTAIKVYNVTILFAIVAVVLLGVIFQLRS